jgi:hypothetical protein
MITTGAKLYLAIAGLAAAAAALYGWGTGGGLSGVLTGGFDGSMGEHAGFTVLVVIAAAGAVLGCVVLAFRDADPDAVQRVVGVDELPEATPPATGSYWPVLGAFAVIVGLLGLVISPALFILGAVVAGLVGIEWLVQAWADRATGDPEANRQIRNRFMQPIEFPAIAVIGIVVAVLAFSRVLLALPKSGSTLIAIVVAILVLTVAFLLAAKPRLSRSLVAGLAVIAAVAVLAGGIVAAAVGERDFEKHTEEHSE